MDHSATEDEFASLVEQAEWAWFGGSDPDLFYRRLFTPYAPGELEKMSEADESVRLFVCGGLVYK